MKEKPEEMKMNLSKYHIEFLKLIDDNPMKVFDALSERDVLKPLIWRDSIGNGGKHGYRGIAKKYNLTENEARRILSNIKNKIKNG